MAKSNNEAVLKALIKAKQLISHPENWTKGSFAIDENGHQVMPNSKDAVAFCALGAVKRATRSGVVTTFVADVCVNTLVRSLPDRKPYRYFISEFNDHPEIGHADVLGLFDRAIEEQRKIVEG